MALRNVNTSVYYLNRRANLIKSPKLKDITAPVPQYHRLLELKKAKNVGKWRNIHFMFEFIKFCFTKRLESPEKEFYHESHEFPTLSIHSKIPQGVLVHYCRGPGLSAGPSWTFQSNNKVYF